MKSIRINKQSGAVSLFVVIFAMLIITVITISFLRLMMTDQQQATASDLSQSAYDSAQAGVEDAKRALLRYQQICTTSPSDCGKLRADIQNAPCNGALLFGSVVNSGDVSGTSGSDIGEVNVQQSEGTDDKALRQAYTCVTIQPETDDYIGNLTPGTSQLVPLVGKSDFNTVTINWFNRDDVSTSDGSVSLPGVGATHLPSQANWNANTPPVMRAQLIQFGSSFTMSDFDSVTSSGGTTQSNGNTVFLFPTSAATTKSDSFTGLDSRSNGSGDDADPASPGTTPRRVQCKPSVSGGGYACSMSLTLPDPVGGGSRHAFMRLTPFYTGGHFQVILSNGDPTSSANIVKFQDVQPLIDSTGRANDIFRRVQSRVNLYNTDFPYPDATIDVTGNFCKSFSVSTNASVYDNSLRAGGCNP